MAFKRHSRSSVVALFDNTLVLFYKLSNVTISLSRIVSEIALSIAHVAFTSPSLLLCQPNLQSNSNIR